MKVEFLETIVLTLALDKREGCTEALKEIVHQNESIMKDAQMYEKIIVALASTLEVEGKELTKESKEKVKFMNSILPNMEKNLRKLLDILLEKNFAESNAIIINLANNAKFQERVRTYLIDNLDSYFHNSQIVDMVIALPNFNFNFVKYLAFDLKEYSKEEYKRKHEEYLHTILKILNTGKVTEIDTEFFENVFSLSSNFETEIKILNVLLEYLKKEEISQNVNKAEIFDFLVENKNYPILGAWIEKEEEKDSLIEIFKNMNRFKTLVHYILEEWQENSKFFSIIENLITDIDYECLIRKCFPDDIITLITIGTDFEKKDGEKEANIKIQKVIEKTNEIEDEDIYFYENFLFSLLERECYTSSIQKILQDFTLDLTYMPLHVYGPQSLAYWIASLGNKEVVKTLLEIEHLPSVIYGSGAQITLSSLFFKIGNIKKGLETFLEMDLFMRENYTLFHFDKYEVEYEERYNYQDEVTQIIHSVLDMEDTEEQIKKNLIATILLDKKVEYVNLNLFEILSDLYSKEELRILYENLKNRAFISYKKDTDLGTDTIVAVEISTTEEIQDMVANFIETNIVPKRTQKNIN